MTALIGKNIEPTFKWSVWRGSFDSVKDYLIHGFYAALDEFKSMIENPELANELGEIVEYCCYPIPVDRGNPNSVTLVFNKQRKRKAKVSQYDLQRVVTRMDVLSKKALFVYGL